MPSKTPLFPLPNPTLTKNAPTTVASPLGAFRERLRDLYNLSQRSNHVFGSPLGPLLDRGTQLHVPRFVYFGPLTHDESLRLAILAGFNHSDLRSSLALTQFVEHLVLTPDLGHGLNISLFPIVDVIGLHRDLPNRQLETRSWANTGDAVLGLLAKDARTRGYHGFLRIETAPGEETIAVRIRGTTAAAGIELISSEEFQPLPVRWEADQMSSVPQDGPLTLVDDLPFPPFELTFRIPGAWPSDLYCTAVSSALKRFILRYRGLQAYGHGI
ncbi:MAG: hypothetical protein QM790_10075 [Nibricoccus sp.]